MSEINGTGKTLLLIAILILAGSLFLYYVTYSFPPAIVPNAPGPATLPRLALIGILILLFFAVFEVFKLYRGASSGESSRDILLEIRHVAVASALTIFFAALLSTLGFEAVSFVLLFSGLVYATRDLKKSFILAVLGVLGCYVIFIAILKVYAETSFLPQRPLLFLGY